MFSGLHPMRTCSGCIHSAGPLLPEKEADIDNSYICLHHNTVHVPVPQPELSAKCCVPVSATVLQVNALFSCPNWEGE